MAFSQAYANNIDKECAEKIRQIGMVTGGQSGTYKVFGENIRDLILTEGNISSFEICVKLSKGSFSNVKRMASTENAGIGIVQSDVIEVLKNNKIFKGANDVKALRLIAPLYNEEVHLFAKKSIKSINDLKGKRVNVGSIGGGSWVTATAIFDEKGFSVKEQPILENYSHEDAKQAVLNGSLDAMFYVAGKPVSLFSDLQKYDTTKVHFVPINASEFSTLPYFPANIGQQDYSWLNSTIKTISVKALLVSYDFSRSINSYHDIRCNQFESIGAVIRDEISILKSNNSGRWHKKWSQVDLDVDVPGWERDLCSWNSISMVTGSKKGTYFAFGNQIRDISKNRVFLEIKNSKGSLENVRRMNGKSRENAAIGIVQSDVINLLQASTSDVDREMAKSLRLITPLYNEEVHLLAKKDITNFRDLDNKTLSVLSETSGSYMTAQNLSLAFGIRPNYEFNSTAQAFQRLKNSQVDGMIFVGGKPISFFEELNKRFKQFPNDFNDLHIVPIKQKELPSGLPYVDSHFSPAEYHWIDKKVPTVAIKSMLVARDFFSKKDKYSIRRCQQLNDIYSAITNNFSMLVTNSNLSKGSKGRTHEKWQEVKLGSGVSGWKLDKCSHQALAVKPKPIANKTQCDKYKSASYKSKNPGWRTSYNGCLLSK